MTNKIVNTILYIIVVGSIIFGAYAFFHHFFVSDIPLGYDPGLYKEMLHSYAQLTNWDFTQLPVRMQRMYPPFLGMEWSIFSEITGLDEEWGVRRGAGWLGVILCLSIGAYAKRLGGDKAGLIALSFAFVSFTIYNLFRRNYLKQMFASTLLIFVLLLRSRKAYLLSIPILIATLLTHRPAMVVIVMIGVGVLISYGIKKNRKSCIQVLKMAVATLLIALPIYRSFLADQFLRMIRPFFKAVDFTVKQDGFQSGGTFLTTIDFLSTDTTIIIAGILGVIVSVLMVRKGVFKRDGMSHELFTIPFILLIARVGFQRFFFQRMIGYLVIFLILGAGLLGSLLLKKYPKTGLIVIIGSILFQAYQSFYWIKQIQAPIIERDEFGFINQFDDIIKEPDAIIVVPGIAYSPRVLGWSSFDVIAPGLYSLNKRGLLSNAWQENRMLASGFEKCDALLRDYGPLGRKLYIWIGSKQQFTDMAGGCFQLMKAQEDPFAALYRVDFEDE